MLKNIIESNRVLRGKLEILGMSSGIRIKEILNLRDVAIQHSYDVKSRARLAEAIQTRGNFHFHKWLVIVCSPFFSRNSPPSRRFLSEMSVRAGKSIGKMIGCLKCPD